MPHGDQRVPSIRADTDFSLRAERAKTDEELSRRRDEAEADVDSTVRAARDQADAALESSRWREDAAPAARDAKGGLAQARAREDEDLSAERTRADSNLEAERVKGQVVLASLLAAERHRTDSQLLLERERTDAALTNRDDFLAMLSHDLRSLLGGIALKAALIERQREGDPDRIVGHAVAIQRSAAQMSRLVADLLDVASIDSGKLVLVRAPHDARRLVLEAVEGLELTADERGIALSVDVPKEALCASFDPGRLAQVLANLMSNTVKFTHSGGQIIVSLSRCPSEICFCVADTGEGIPPDKLEAVFDRYSQVGRADRRGLGLGLYIARRIVQAHGGRLWAESALGRGSRFFFTVPTAVADSSSLEAPAPPT